MSDTVNVIGVKADGSADLLGTAPMPPRMKAREIAREYFGGFTEDDGSDADSCFSALVWFLDWLEAQGWQPPPVVVVTPAG
jgi:hypothetical protein